MAKSVTFRDAAIAAIIVVILGIGGFYLWNRFSAGPEAATSLPASTPTSTAVQANITRVDSGQTFIYGITSRFGVVLDSTRYSSSSLACVPTGVAGGVSNIPSVSPPLFAKRFEIVSPGECDLKDGDFSIHIIVPNDPAKTANYVDQKLHYSLTYSVADAYIPKSPAAAGLFTGNPAAWIELARNDYTDTNLSEAAVVAGASSDSRVVASCMAPTQGETDLADATINGVTFRSFSAHDAAAGNRYDTTDYRAVHNGNCYDIREFIHYGVFENYSPGAVAHFDENAVSQKLDAIAKTFRFTDAAAIPTSGIVGEVTLGPTCPVERIPPDPQCAPKPYQTSIGIYENGALVNFVKTDSSGNYSVDLPPGDYTLEPAGGNPLPSCKPQNVTVTSGVYATANLTCDTGIR